MSQPEIIEITLNNWSKMNPRRDVKKSTWFRLEHSLIDDPEFYSFTDAEFKAWIYVLSMASRKSSAAIKLYTEHADRSCRIKPKDLKSAIRKLEELGHVTADVTHPSRGRHASVTLRDETRRDETNETGLSSPRPAALDSETLFQIWNDYCAVLPKCKVLSDSRKKKAAAQLRKYPDKGHWLESLRKLTESDWVTSNWRPGFDDWLSETKRLRAIEGRYDDKKAGAGTFTDRNRNMFEKFNQGENSEQSGSN